MELLWWVGFVLVLLILAYGLRWWWWPLVFPSQAISPQGKAVLVTGAASGIGKETTLLLAERGCFVFAVDVNEDLLQKEFGDHPNVMTLKGDVTSQESANWILEKVEESGKSLFGLVNNAGIAHPPVTLYEMSEEMLRRVLDVNLIGMWRMSKTFMPLFIEERKKMNAAHCKYGPCIVNITSLAGLISVPFMGAYCMSKFGGEAFSDALRRELLPLGIDVCIVEPSWANTPILNQVTDINKNSYHYAQIEARVKHLSTYNLLPPRQIAQSIADMLFLYPRQTRKKIARPQQALELFFARFILPDKQMDNVVVNLLDKKYNVPPIDLEKKNRKKED